MTGLPGRLREEREKQGLEQKQLGRLAGVSQSQISRIEAARERWAGTTAATIIRLAAALRVRVGWLLVGEEPKWVDFDDRPGTTARARRALQAELAGGVRRIPKRGRAHLVPAPEHDSDEGGPAAG